MKAIQVDPLLLALLLSNLNLPTVSDDGVAVSLIGCFVDRRYAKNPTADDLFMVGCYGENHPWAYTTSGYHGGISWRFLAEDALLVPAGMFLERASAEGAFIPESYSSALREADPYRLVESFATAA
jgi:hypothetical protein